MVKNDDKPTDLKDINIQLDENDRKEEKGEKGTFIEM